MKPVSTAIQIRETDKGWAVTCNGRSANNLCWDEMLGQIATLTHPDIKTPRYAMRTPEEEAAWLAHLSRPPEPEPFAEVGEDKQ